MSAQRPSVGRTVHYVSYGTPGGEYTSECRAAIITEVLSEGGTDGITPARVSLAVLNPGGMFFNRNLPEVDAAEHLGGTWHWPERVD